MLLDNFYDILQISTEDQTAWTVCVRLTPDHALYKGHFPGQPVVPGVCMLQIIKECAEEIRQQPLQYTQISSCKFLSALNPQETGLLELRLALKDTEEGTLQIQAEGTVAEKGFIKLKAQLKQK